MKKGDTIPVSVNGHVVVQAEVKEVKTEEGLVTFIIPGTLVTMGLRSELTDLPEQKETPAPEKQVLIDGVDRATSAPVGEPAIQQNVAETSATDMTPVVPPAPVEVASTEANADANAASVVESTENKES